MTTQNNSNQPLAAGKRHMRWEADTNQSRPAKQSKTGSDATNSIGSHVHHSSYGQAKIKA